MAYIPMEVLVERRCAKYIYTVPEGLAELMSDISREVIRNNTDINRMYTFIADYLDSLFITRENCRVATQLTNNVIATGKMVTRLMREADCSKKKADYAARVIQYAYRGYLNRKRGYNLSVDYTDEEVIEALLKKMHINHSKAVHAAIIIQKAFRDFRRRSLLFEDKTLDWRYKARRTIGIFKQSQPATEELHRAATLIKAAYKGYYTRKKIQESIKAANEGYDRDVDILAQEGFGDEAFALNAELLQKAREDQAALVIQKLYRGYSVRKEFGSGDSGKSKDLPEAGGISIEDYFNKQYGSLNSDINLEEYEYEYEFESYYDESNNSNSSEEDEDDNEEKSIELETKRHVIFTKPGEEETN